MGQNYFYCQATFNRLANEDFAKKALGKKKREKNAEGDCGGPKETWKKCY